MKFKISKEYLFSLRYYLLFSALLFLFSVGAGYLFAKNYPDEVEKTLEQFQTILEPIKEMSRIQQVFFVFLNNSLTGFFAILFGVILGFFPLLVVFANGEMLGIMIFLSEKALPLSVFFTGIFPHGIIEIPVLIFCGAMGLKIGKKVFKKIFKKRDRIKEEMKSALSFFFKVLMPLLFLAAVIEIYITQELLVK